MGDMSHVAGVYVHHREEQRHHAQHPQEEGGEEPRMDLELSIHVGYIPPRCVR